MKQEYIEPMKQEYIEPDGFKGTTGEFKIAQNELCQYTILTDDMIISNVLAIDIPDEEGQANAELLAASKDLARALQDICRCCAWCQGSSRLSWSLSGEMQDIAKEALKKARLL